LSTETVRFPRSGSGPAGRYRLSTTGLSIACLLLIGCRQDMHNQAKLRPLKESRFFADGQASRLPPAGTVARGHLRDDDRLYKGVDAAGQFLEDSPIPVDLTLVRRGQERFGIFCAPCHGALGDGNGMIVQRGYKQPPSFHDPRLRTSPAGYFYDVITNGFAEMPAYASQIPPEDRWAIVAYVRALQLSQNARLLELEPSDRERLRGQPLP
jgi:mono/diheme cytochrome c family protein